MRFPLLRKKKPRPAQPVPRFAAALALAGLAALACAAPPADKERFDPPPILEPLMQSLRGAARDFKRALVLEREDLYLARARDLDASARPLMTVEAPAGFTEQAQEMLALTGDLVKAARRAEPPDRLSRLFSEAMGSCIDCHRIFRAD